MFHRLSKHHELRQNSTARRIFNSLLGVWIPRWNTVSHVWYITLTVLEKTIDSVYSQFPFGEGSNEFWDQKRFHYCDFTITFTLPTHLPACLQACVLIFYAIQLRTIYSFCSFFTFTENYPPRIITDLSQINVTVNQSVAVTVVAEDPNNDTLSFSIIGVLPSDAVLLNNSNSITITWNGTMEQVEKKIKLDY